MPALIPVGVLPTRNINTTSPLTGGGNLSGDRTIGINNAAADGTTKGASTYTASDFNDNGSGLISLDYVNGQKANGSQPGFLASGDWTTFNNKVATTRVINTTSPITGGGDLSADRTIAINNAAADGTTKGAAAFTAADFNDNGSGLISIDYTNGQAASASNKGFLTSTDWTTFNNKVATTRNINTTSPITGGGDLSADRTIAINNAAADGSTKGAATFTAADFNDNGSGLISLDYTNGQKATTSQPGFLTSADWNTFNNKYDASNFADDWRQILAGLGTAILYESGGVPLYQSTITSPITSGTAIYQPVYIRKAQNITGVKWYQTVAGAYTADTSNVIGLFSYSGGTLTLVASSLDDGTIWKTTANTMGNKAFNGGVYAAAAGLYYIGILYHTSAQTTQPQILGATAMQGGNVSLLDFTNSAKLYATKNATTSLATVAMSALSQSATRYWLALY